MKRREPLPFSGAQIQISSLFYFVWVSHTQLVRDPREPQTTTQPVFMSPPSTHPFLSLALSSSSSSPLLIALLIFPLTSEYEKGGGGKKKKHHKLSKSHWPTSPDISLGIHVSAKELEEEMFSHFPPSSLFQLEAIFLASRIWSCVSTSSTLYKWINALLWHNRRFGALSPLLTVA